MVEVFKTNIDCETVANEVMMDLQTIFPAYKINFDLDDCDRIMRIESENISVSAILTIFKQFNISCTPLE